MKKLADKEFKDLLQQCVAAWGADSQKLMAIEEMAELTQELAKHLWRDHGNKEKIAKNEQDIREEIADVLITVAQMRYIFGEDEVDTIINRKMQRLADRLKNWQEEQK